MAKTVKVIEEDNNGRNTKFLNTKTGEKMSRAEFVKQIEEGNYDDYHIRKINGTKTPVSDPDTKESNNLG
jgi:hypothetical protein